MHASVKDTVNAYVAFEDWFSNKCISNTLLREDINMHGGVTRDETSRHTDVHFNYF